MSIKRIHFNRNRMLSNVKHGTNKPVITVKESGTNRYGHAVDILGPSRVVFLPENPLSCGAKCWIETWADVILEGETNAT